MERRPLLIVGSGPAGTATGLFLHRHDPALAREILIVEKAHHPRTKVCAGGLIPHTLDCLEELGVPLSVPNAVAHRARVEIPGRVVAYEGRELCRVVRRDEFDHSLVLACRQRGIEVRESEKVVDLRREEHSIRVETERASYQAHVVIGADGSGSIVRRQLVGDAERCIGKALMCDVPAADADWSGLSGERYDFNFAPVRDGLRGYAWAFPCVIRGVPHVNVGVYSVRADGTGAQLAAVLKDQLARLGAPAVPIKSFPIRYYGRRARIAAPHVLLAGDAAGAEPLMGEGISYAFEYARRAAAAVTQALAGDERAYADYERSVADSWMGKKLRRLGLGVRLFYGPTWRLWFAVAAHSRRMQDIGIRWYNGVDGWDRRSGWDAVRACLGGDRQSVPS